MRNRPRGNFFVRHIRGFVCLILLVIFALVVGYWLMFGSGQRVLGQLYISRNPDTYVELGQEADAAGNYEEAGAYYLKALELDPTDRTTAINAANAYIRAGNSGRAATALEYLIAIDPNDPAPYNDAQAALSGRGLAPAARHPAFAAGRAKHGRRQSRLNSASCRMPPFPRREAGVFAPKRQNTPFFCNITIFCCIFAQFAKILPTPLTNPFRRGIL